MRWTGWALLAFAPLSGCLSTVELELPPPVNERTLVLAIEDPPGALRLLAAPVGGDRSPVLAVPIAIRKSARLTALYFKPRPEELLFDTSCTAMGGGQAACPLPLAAGPASRPLPRFNRAFDHQGDAAGFLEVTSLSAALAGARLPAIEPDRCARAGGCLDAAAAVDVSLDCKVPCPEPPLPTAPALPQPPAAPEPPRFLPCPSGWTEVLSEDRMTPATCEPPAIPRIVRCNGARAQRFGSSACAPVGSVCPSGPWPEGIPSGRPALYVRSGAPAGGDGTKARPYGSIASALFSAPPGSLVAIAQGTYDEALVARPGVLLLGACPEATVIEAQGVAAVIYVAPDTAGVEIRNLTLRGALYGLLADGPHSSALVEDTIIERTTGVALHARTGAEVTVRETLIEDGDGSGLAVLDGTSLNAEGLVIERIHGAGILIGGPADQHPVTARMRAIAIRSLTNGINLGLGLLAGPGASVELSGASIEDTEASGIIVQGAAATSTLSDILLSNHAQSTERPVGLVVAGGATAALRRIAIESYASQAVYIGDPGTSAVIEDAVIRDTKSHTTGYSGAGLFVVNGARVELRRALFERNLAEGIFLGSDAQHDQHSDLELADVIVRDSLVQEVDRSGGYGIEARSASTVTGSRVLLERCAGHGLVFADNARATLSDVIVPDQEPLDAVRSLSGALAIGNAAEVQLARSLIERYVSVQIQGLSARVNMSDATLRAPPTAPRDLLAAAVEMSAGRLEIARARLDGLPRGFTFTSTHARAKLTDVFVHGPERCDATVPANKDSTGVEAVFGAELIAERVLVECAARGVRYLRATDRSTGSTGRVDDLTLRNISLLAVEVDGPATATIARGLFTDLTREGVRVSKEGVVTLRDIRLERIRADADGTAVGVEVADRASLLLSRFAISGSAQYGINVEYGYLVDRPGFATMLDVKDGRISGNRIGARLANEALPLSRLLVRVLYAGNDTALAH